MPTIEQLEPANKADVLVYMPYYAKDKHSILPYAIALYRGGSLEGRRHIENSEGIPFVASWYVSKLPSELTRCRLQFEGQADLRDLRINKSPSRLEKQLVTPNLNYGN
ncbi:type IV pilus biogenesis protein EbsA [Microcystis aeruginosa]|uniref:type IV pilus biogenesis protein EbsA n=1 Tax=Microcystis aeruginosa TaxID=1126 RepID=UPI00233029F1|nr:type IV pilus biogenesis protein EbsA [Microcystis aeruginosa]MDB9395014.1 hypothetical protein [Microcystis aeruginosa CS-573]